MERQMVEGNNAKFSLDKRSRYLLYSNDYTPNGDNYHFVYLIEFDSQGWLKYSETLTEGFEKLPEAFISML